MAHGSLTAGTAALPLTVLGYPIVHDITLRADINNTGEEIFIGDSASVTAGSAAATDGFELPPGASITLGRAFAQFTNQIFVIASAATQKVFWITSTTIVDPASYALAMSFDTQHTSSYAVII